MEWNPNPEIADAAEKLYGDIENLELYVGLQAEEAKPVVDGAGLCPGLRLSPAGLSTLSLTLGRSSQGTPLVELSSATQLPLPEATASLLRTSRLSI